jgi:very-short-patch-repair endonuclease
MEIKLQKRSEVKKEYGKYYRNEVSDSEPEMILFETFLKKKIRPEKQYPVDKYFCDLALPEYKIDIEYDGEIHLSESVKEKDRERDEKLKSLGWEVVRVSKKYIRSFHDEQEFPNNLFLLENIFEKAVGLVIFLIRKRGMNKNTFLADYASEKLNEDGLPKFEEKGYGFAPIGEFIKYKKVAR